MKFRQMANINFKDATPFLRAYENCDNKTTVLIIYSVKPMITAHLNLSQIVFCNAYYGGS